MGARCALLVAEEEHPTLSTITDEIMSVHPGRALVFALWLTLGWLLVTSPRIERQ